MILNEAQGVWDRLVPLQAGKCQSASIALAIRLAAVGIDTVLIEGAFRGHKHWWLKCGALVIDPTAGQFKDQPNVFVGVDHRYCTVKEHHYFWEDIAIALGFDVYSPDDALLHKITTAQYQG